GHHQARSGQHRQGRREGRRQAGRGEEEGQTDLARRAAQSRTALLRDHLEDDGGRTVPGLSRGRRQGRLAGVGDRRVDREPTQDQAQGRGGGAVTRRRVAVSSPTDAEVLGGAVMRHTRPRGYAAWSPQAKKRALLAQVLSVLHEYLEYLPLTIRQVFY